MAYYFATTIDADFESAIEKATQALSEEGFGVLTTIDVSTTLKNKLDVDMPRYTILGACNPAFANKALQAENKIGTMLPCNVVVQDVGEGKIEVAVVDPMASMQAIENSALADIATQVREKLQSVVSKL